MLADGSFIEAPIVISNATHHVTFKNLIKDQSVIPEEYQTGLKNISYEGSACKINLVLNDFPQLNCLPELNERARHAKSMEEKKQIYKNYL